MCNTATTEKPTLVTVKDHELHRIRMLEVKLSQRMIRRKDRKLRPIINRIKSGFENAMRMEKSGILERFDAIRYQLNSIFIQSSAGRVDLTLNFANRKMTRDELRRIMDELSRGISPALYKRILEENYIDIFNLASIEASSQISFAIGWNIRHRVAEQWTRERSAEYINRYLPGLKDESLRRIQSQLVTGMQRGESIPEIRDRLEKLYDVGFKARAETWARTETNRAYGHGTVEVYRDMGVEKKYWISSGSPYAAVDVCGENAAMGSIKIDGSFSDIDGNPIDSTPAHPNCMCSVGFDIQDDWIPNENIEALS